MRSIQTSPIGNDAKFEAIRDTINRQLAKHGFPLRYHKGSASWLAGAGHPQRANDVFFKLLHLPRGKPFIFGIRKDLAESIDKLRALRWPEEFAAMPKHDVAFVGFYVPPDGVELIQNRLEKILKALPEPDPRLEIRTGEDDGFDLQLETL